VLPKFLADLDPKVYFSDNYVVLDFEIATHHGDYGNPVHKDNQPLMVCWKVGPAGQVRCSWGDEYSGAYTALLADIAAADFIVAHQAKYELGWLRRLGADLRSILPFDTRLAEYVLLGNLAAGAKELGMKPMSTSLDMCCRRRGLPVKDPVVDVLIHNGVNPIRIPRPWLEGRCRQDVETTEAVFLDQRRDLARRGLLPVLYTRCLLTPVLADIEPEGLALDSEAVTTTLAEYREKEAQLQTEMEAMTGGINYRSPDQRAEFIYDVLKFPELVNKRGEPKRTPEGKRKTDKKTLELFVAKTKRQEAFLTLWKELGRVNAAITKNLLFFKGVVDEYDSEFFAEINQANTATHRLASRGIPLTFRSVLTEDGEFSTRSVQFQNTPRGFKRLFRAKRRGFRMAEPDGSGAEFRAAVILSGDNQGRRDIEDKSHDPHRFTASVLHNVSIEQVKANEKEAKEHNRDSWRQLAKPDTFKPLYGGSKGTPEQERYYAAFRERYAGIAETQQSWLDSAVRNKYVITPWGLVYYFPTAKVNQNGWSNVTSAVFNYPIQAFATAEITLIALVYLWHGIREQGLEQDVFIVNQVHDSSPCEVRIGKEQEFTDLAKRCYTADVYTYMSKVYGLDFDLPLGVGIKIGDHWGTGEEQSFDVYPDGREVRVK
jgi:DNA polymerase I-like protein with 3'-5' exonuclease and polymerase domains